MTMNRSKAIVASATVLRSLLAARVSSTQVTHLSHLSTYTTLPISHESRPPHSIHTLQRLYFSSKPNSIVRLVLANVWSHELEQELKKSTQTFTHEAVIYVLRKLYKDPQKAFHFFNWVCEKNYLLRSSSIYSLMLRIFLHGGSMKLFWITVRKMKEQGFYIDEETYSTTSSCLKKEKLAADAVAFAHFYDRMLKENAKDAVAKKVVDVVLREEWSSEVERELEEMKVGLSDNFVIRVLKELRIHPSKAVKFFHWIGQCSCYEHNTITFNAILRVVARHDSIGEFWTVFEEMKTAGHEMDIDTYIKISRQFQKCRMMVDAVKLYELMMDSPYKPSVQDCSILLRTISVGEHPDLDLVFRVAKKYESMGHSLSKSMYDGIHRSLTSSRRFDEAEKIMKVMKNAGHEPDNITYSQLVFGLCKAKRFEEACKVLDDMEAQGCIPDIKTWTILIQGHCAANKLEKALIHFVKMVEKNCSIDADLLDVLVNGFLNQKRVDGAYKLLLELVKTIHLRPWQATFKNLIEKLLGIRKVQEALNLLVLMKKQNYPPYPEPFIRYISKFGTVEDAVEFLKALSVKEYPSSSAYLRVLKSFLEEGRHCEAKDLLYKCPHHIRTNPEVSQLFGSAFANSGNTTA